MNMPRIDNALDVICKQNEIIRQQSDIIDSLYLLLMQHITVEEIENTQLYANMEKVTENMENVM